MKEKTIIFYSNVLIFIALSLIALVFEIIFYEYLQLIFPSDTTFLGMPFNLPAFMFGLTFILTVAILSVIVFFYPKSKKTIEKINDKKKVI